MEQGCSLRMSTRLDLVQSLALVGGLTSTIFPQVEAMLINSTDYQGALMYVAKWKKTDNYRSMMDFMFVELHPEWRYRCKAFYRDKGLKLMDQITTEQLLEYNDRMLKALEIALDIYRENRGHMGKCSWMNFSQKVHKAA